jgi:hypothetical protein
MEQVRPVTLALLLFRRTLTRDNNACRRLSQMNAETNALRNTIVKCMDTAHHANTARKERETRQRLLAGTKTVRTLNTTVTKVS